MKNVSDEYKQIAETLDGSARYYHQILVDGVELTDTIVEFKYSHTCNNSTNFSVGNTASAMVEFKIDEPSINLENKEIQVNQGLKLADGSMEYVKLGKFKVLSPETERFQANYQCVDAMTYKMATVYESALTYPSTDIAILEEICQQAGIELANTDLVAHAIDRKMDNYTKREMIGFIAQLQGKNAIISTDGKLELIWYTQTDYVVDDNRIYSDRTDIIKNENNYVLGYIKSTYGSKEIASGDIDTQGIRITNPYMTQDILDEVFNKIKGLTFRAINVDFYGDFRLEVGDIVTVNTNNESYVVPIMTLEQSSDGGVVTTIESIGETATQNSVDTNGSILNEIKRSVVNSETARSIAEQSADKINFVVEGDTASEFTVTENVIQATTEKLVIKTEKGGEVVIKDGVMYVDDIFAEEINATGSITGAKLYGTYAEIDGGKVGGFELIEGTLVSIRQDGKQIMLSSNAISWLNGGQPCLTFSIDGLTLEQIENIKNYNIFDFLPSPTLHLNAITTDTIITGDPLYVAKPIMLKISADKIEALNTDGTTISTLLSTDSTGKTIIPKLEVTGNTTLKGTLYFGEDNSKYINASGNAVLNSLKLSTNSGVETTEVAYKTLYITTGLRRMQMAVSSDGSMGIYDATDNIKKWLIKSDLDQNIVVNGASLSIAPNTTVTKTSASISYVGVKNSKREGRLLTSADGYVGLWDVTNNRWLCYSDADGHFVVPNSHELKAYGGFTAFGGTMTSTLNTQNVVPTTNSTSTSTGYTIGTSNYRYRYLYAFGSSIQTSDRNYKHSFDYEDVQRLDSFFNALKPCSYYMVGGDRKHLGFVAQDVEEAMIQNGMTIDDLSFVCKDAEYTLKDEKQPDTEENREYALDEDGNQKYIYGLKYTELHAMEVDQIQRLKTRVSNLEFALSQALARIEMLEEKISK